MHGQSVTTPTVHGCLHGYNWGSIKHGIRDPRPIDRTPADRLAHSHSGHTICLLRIHSSLHSHCQTSARNVSSVLGGCRILLTTYTTPTPSGDLFGGDAPSYSLSEHLKTSATRKRRAVRRFLCLCLVEDTGERKGTNPESTVCPRNGGASVSWSVEAFG